ncbi:BNR repeat-containing protein [Halopiger xanaduensis]|uniref:Uncharacterized protein n=1 Tax=Halopiger xanaduensis (strain DSM 18323 / JCM 14033 / SH-6) TaxID=797210 RepID=F8D7T7_HALXS|nr:BNR repeat-containing protein [Halopiger xanaduensis]AEH35541.1 hypothetical protein Halxa_0904 [Halopiger xanaduensis SH-6]
MSPNTELEERTRHEVADVWAGTAAAFDLYTHGEHQFVAFYDADRNITVGQRELGTDDADEAGEWTVARLPEDRKIEWDAHNSLALAVDREDYLHLSGNMHVHPLKYYRTRESLDVTTFERIDEMVGTEESQVTYPQFFRGPDDELVFKYRDGYSGGGNWRYNVYDERNHKWNRLLEAPLTYGGDAMNAYPHGPVVGPGGDYHCCWVWRDHGGAQTNHDLCYARSPDLREWETSQGAPLELPIDINSGDLVDPVPPYGGMINNNTKIGFDTAGRVVISYHKFDHEGNTQLYNARAEADGWEIYRTSDWDYRWAFGGGGTIPFEIEFGPVEREDGRLIQTYDHVEYGTGKWVLDEEMLTPTDWYSPWHTYPDALRDVRSDYPDMQVNWVADSSDSPGETQYALRWESLEPNRDREREEAPPPTRLTVHEFEPQG